MKSLLYISFFLCCYSGSLKNVNHIADESRLNTNSETNLPEINISSDIAYIHYLIYDETIYFDTQSEDNFLLNKTGRQHQGQGLLAQRTFHQDHPFCFSKSTDPFLELDIPPPCYS